MSETMNAPEVGDVLLLPVGKLIDDPDNPRTERDPKWKAKLDASIAADTVIREQLRRGRRAARLHWSF